MHETPTTLAGEALLRRVVELCHEKKAEDLVVLDVRELVEYMDFLVVYTARGERQNQAVVTGLVRALKREGTQPLSVAGQEAGRWVCLDLVDVVVHGFVAEARRLYDLELLWADAKPWTMEPAAPDDAAPPEDEST